MKREDTTPDTTKADRIGLLRLFDAENQWEKSDLAKAIRMLLSNVETDKIDAEKDMVLFIDYNFINTPIEKIIDIKDRAKIYFLLCLPPNAFRHSGKNGKISIHILREAVQIFDSIINGMSQQEMYDILAADGYDFPFEIDHVAFQAGPSKG